MGFSIGDYDQRQAFALERKLLLFAGFYPKRDRKHLYLYRFSAFMNLLISYGQLVTMIIQMVIDRTELSKLTESLLYFFTHFTFLLKLLNFQYYEKNLLRIEDTLTDSDLYGFSFEQLKIIESKVNACHRIGSIFRTLCSITVSFFGLIPFIDDSKKMSLPLPGWLPYDTQKYYFSTVLVQWISIVISAYCNTAIDILTWKMLTLGSAHFEILLENLEKIDYSSHTEEIKRDLISCIQHHTKIVNYCKQVEAVFSKSMFVQFFCSALVICTTGFQMLVVPIPSIQFAALVTYFNGMMCQVATYCWYGHDVFTTSDKIGRSFYMANWYQSDNRVRKLVLIFLENTKKATVIKAGGFITLSLETLMQILRSSYSYFAVLQRLYDDDK